ncbi:MAG: hypothetical protein ACD_71C00128G0003 [uncultured bacterium (gcode 4)]|uniref:PEGA domain-containing protein n=1 Tax=uncultured bacterium (gcode 4) TaxID=1234023 RepID=K1YNB0_9BACT|nr:MAG: hypothetical protein ACD_71C00128G0003 [uncultured bacterium (gcode 4)]
MIPSYQEEIRIHKNKDRIFWVVVIVMTAFLFFFFQGYYPNYERFFNQEDTSKQAFLKPFGIIDIHVFPSPDNIFINGEPYNNNSKTIFDLGEYTISIQKKWYLPITLLLDITKKNPFYTTVVNLFANPEYSPLPLAFSGLSLYGDFFLLHDTSTGSLLVVDTDFQILHRIETTYEHIGWQYFTDGNNILSYSQSTEKFSNIIDRETGIPLQCTNISYYGEKLFCHDTMRFAGPTLSNIREKILAINDRIVVTPEYIYNGDNTNTSWKYFEYQTGALQFPEAVVHIGKIPYFFEKWILFPVDQTDVAVTPLKKPDWWMDIISQVWEFDGETILFGEKQGKGIFRIVDSEKEYSKTLDLEHTTDVKVYKISGAYIFVTQKTAYVYYKGATEILKILDDVDVIRMVDAKIFFNKEGKSYLVDLLRKEVK